MWGRGVPNPLVIKYHMYHCIAANSGWVNYDINQSISYTQQGETQRGILLLCLGQSELRRSIWKPRQNDCKGVRFTKIKVPFIDKLCSWSYLQLKSLVVVNKHVKQHAMLSFRTLTQLLSDNLPDDQLFLVNFSVLIFASLIRPRPVVLQYHDKGRCGQ